MKSKIILLFLLICTFSLKGQISIPYENFYHHERFPKSNEKITFSLLHPFTDFPDSLLDSKTTYQFLIYLPVVSDSALNQYIKFAMLSLNFEQKYCNYKNGAEIWYGATKTNIPTVTGLYYKNLQDSTILYVLTGYSLTYFDKKSKTDLSRLICERIQLILNRDKSRK
jgi:hypothetical protein